jgi:uncharacterized protein
VGQMNTVEQASDIWKTFDSGDIYVDCEGDWFYQNNRITREDILESFYDHLQASAENSYVIVWEQQRCALRVDDTPFVITRVDRRSTGSAAGEQFLLTLKHVSAPEVLDPGSLWVGKDHVLYARIRSSLLRARFSRPAYYQIAAWIQEDPATGQFFLEANGERHWIVSQE